MVSAQAETDPGVVAPVADPAAIVADPSEGTAPIEVEGQAGAVVAGAVEEAQKPLSLAEIPESDLLAHLRERKTDDGFSLEDRIRKSERDRYAEERRREAGKVESVTRRTARFLEKYGIDHTEVDRNDLGELNTLSHFAHLDALGDIGSAWVKATADEFSVTDRTLIDEALSKFKTDPTGIDDLASRMLVAVRDVTRTKTLSEVSLKDVPEGSKLHSDLRAEAQRLADAELQARDLAASRPDTPPTAPAGAPPASDDARFSHLTTGEVAALPEPEYRAWQRWRSARP